MSKLLWAGAAALALCASSASAQQVVVRHRDAPPLGPVAALPDFPADAQPGACYARMPAGPHVGPAAPPPPPGARRGEWKLERGHGPEAVWRYSEGVAGRHAAAPPLLPSAAGPYRWVQVACEQGGRPFEGGHHAHMTPPTGTTGAGIHAHAAPPRPPASDVYAEAPPPPMAVPPAPEPPIPPVPPVPPHHAGPMHPGPMHHPGPMPHAGPMHHPGPMPHAGPMHHPGPMAHAGPPAVFFHHGPPMAGPMTPPPPPVSRPRWFADRYLHWAGKAPPRW